MNQKNKNKNQIPSYIQFSTNEFAAKNVAVYFDIIRFYNFPETKSILDKICSQIKENFLHKRVYINNILCNCAYSGYLRKGFYVSRSTNVWADFNREHKKILDRRISITSLKKALDYLVELDYLVCIKGTKKGITGNDDACSTYFASESLLSQLKEQWEYFTDNDNRPAIKLNDKNHEAVDIEHITLPKEVEKRQKTVENCNKEYRKHLITAEIPHVKPVYIGDGQFRMREVKEQMRFGVKLQAIYSQDFTHGGRFYSVGITGGVHHQAMSTHDITSEKIYRGSIRIDGYSTAELDFKSLHIALLYAECGLQYDFSRDAYGWLCAECRALAKKATLTALNCKSFKQAVMAVSYQSGITYAEAEIMLKELLKYHKPVADQFAKKRKRDIGSHLQYIDSCIMEKILDTCLEKGIMVLPVHDSVVVRKVDVVKVLKIMRDAYIGVTGFKCEITCE